MANKSKRRRSTRNAVSRHGLGARVFVRFGRCSWSSRILGIALTMIGCRTLRARRCVKSDRGLSSGQLDGCDGCVRLRGQHSRRPCISSTRSCRAAGRSQPGAAFGPKHQSRVTSGRADAPGHRRYPGFVGGWALSQLWLFWVAPIIGAALAGGAYPLLAGKAPAEQDAARA